MQVKICGLTRVQDAETAVAAGADFLGAIMAGGPRHLEEAAAAAVLGPRRHGVRRAAVFGMSPPAEIAAVARRLALDIVQLHGDPTVDDVARIQARGDCAVWPVVRVEGTALPTTSRELARAAGALVLDAKVRGQLGGTGVPLDWAALAEQIHSLRSGLPELVVVLAGGLNAGNVAQAIGLLGPDVVDVSSGVEMTPGIKDPNAIVAFVQAAQRAGRGVM